MKVDKSKTPLKKVVGLGIKSNSIKKKGTLGNNLKVNRRRGIRPKPSIKKKDKGVVYLSHIPHGFYDEQIEGFFGQFGKVSQVSVPKSKSGRVKGYAFIEFVHPEVAKIAAETMNNYLMFNRLLKAQYIPPQDQKPRLFRKALEAKEHHKTEPERAVLNVKANRKWKNRMLKTSQETRVINKLQKKSNAMSKMMAELGVTYEVQVEQGNCKSVLERNQDLEKRKKLEKLEEFKRKLTDAKKNTDNNKEGSSSEEDESDENLSTSATNDENQISSNDESSSSEKINTTKTQKSKAPKRVLSKRQSPVSVPLIVISSKREHKTKSASGSKIIAIKSNKVLNKQNKVNKSQVSSFKVQKQMQNIKQPNKLSQKNVMLLQTKQKKPKDLQKQITPSSPKLPSIQKKLQLKKGQQPTLLLKEKSPAVKATRSNLLEAVKEPVHGEPFKPTPSKKMKQSEQLKEVIHSPRIKATQKSRQTPSKKSPKPSIISQATSGTPKMMSLLKKSESVGKSPKKRKSQNF